MGNLSVQDKFDFCEGKFYLNYIYLDNPDVMGSNIPLASVRYDNNVPTVGNSGDGLIDMALYMQYLHATCQLHKSTYLKEDKEDVKEKLKYSIYRERILNCLKSIQRLSDSAYNLNSKYRAYNWYYMKKEPGFLLRDDISNKISKEFGLVSLCTSYSSGVEGLSEDPCHSMFMSQDQIWNLLPTLWMLSESWVLNTGEQIEAEIKKLARTIAYDSLTYIIDHNHTIYNPYYSAMLHHWKYLVKFSTPYYERIKERDRKLKYKVKVKRGANNWYYSYGFRRAFEEVTGNTDYCSKFTNFILGLWYRPFIFAADRIFFPLREKFLGLVPKNTSFYSLAVSSGVWYGGSFAKRLTKQFNKSIGDSIRNGVAVDDLFQPQLVFLQYFKDLQEGDEPQSIDLDSLQNWLELYEVKETGTCGNELNFMLMKLYVDCLKS